MPSLRFLYIYLQALASARNLILAVGAVGSWMSPTINFQ